MEGLLRRSSWGSGWAGVRITPPHDIFVAKGQVGLLGSARDLQRDLDRIATRADTNSADGLHYVLEETVLALLRAPEYWVYGEIPPHRGRMRQSGLTHLPSGHAETNNERARGTPRPSSTSTRWRPAASSRRRRW